MCASSYRIGTDSHAFQERRFATAIITDKEGDRRGELEPFQVAYQRQRPWKAIAMNRNTRTPA